MAYLYIHLRLDKNEPFYIGIGEDKIKNKGKYLRAHSKNRNKFWKNITNKTSYKVQILYNNITWEEACTKEIELIQFYGRIDLGNGILCNLTEGGEGIQGFKYSDEVKIKMRKPRVNKEKMFGHKGAMGVKREFSESHLENLRRSKLTSKGKPNLNGRKPRVNKEKMFGPKPGRKVPKPNARKPKSEKWLNTKYKPIIQYDLNGKFIKEWKSQKEAKMITKFKGISNCLLNKSKKSGNFIWKFKT